MLTNETLKALVARIAAHQAALKESDEQFIARYIRYLGSVRTWRYRLNKGETDGIKDVAIWETKWVKTLSELRNEIEGVSAPVNYIAEMPFCRAATARLNLLVGQINDRRNVLMLAPTGCSKSTWAKWQVSQKPDEYTYIAFNEAQRENKYQICAAIARKLGAVDIGRTPSTAIDAVISALNNRPQILFLDEFNEAGIMAMKIVRTLIDHTPSKFVCLGYPTQYDRMLSSRSGAIDEAKQLLGRTLKPVFDDYRAGVPTRDIAIYIRKVVGLDEAQSRIAAEAIGPAVRTFGNLRFLDDVLTDAVCAAQEDDIAVDAQLIIAASKELCPAPAHQKDVA